MKAHELKVIARNPHSRVGRGIAAGQGKTAGRGTKGYGSRTGSTRKPGFEGGQNPLMKRLPKLRGFRSQHIKAEVIYTSQLSGISGTVDNFSLFNAGLLSSPYTRVKLVVKGAITKKVTVKLQGASKMAIEAIQKSGGTFDVTEQVMRTAKPTDDTK